MKKCIFRKRIICNIQYESFLLRREEDSAVVFSHVKSCLCEDMYDKIHLIKHFLSQHYASKWIYQSFKISSMLYNELQNGQRKYFMSWKLNLSFTSTSFPLYFLHFNRHVKIYEVKNAPNNMNGSNHPIVIILATQKRRIMYCTLLSTRRTYYLSSFSSIVSRFYTSLYIVSIQGKTLSH